MIEPSLARELRLGARERLTGGEHAASRGLDGLHGVADFDLDGLILRARLRGELLRLYLRGREVRLRRLVLEGNLNRHADDYLPRLEFEEVLERASVAADEALRDARRAHGLAPGAGL